MRNSFGLFLMTLCILFTLLSTTPSRSDDLGFSSVVDFDSKDVELLKIVYKNFNAVTRNERNNPKPWHPVRFRTDKAPLSDACKSFDYDEERLATMDYRDDSGRPFTVGYQVCERSNNIEPKQIVRLIPGSEHEIASDRLVFQRVIRTQRATDDSDNCSIDQEREFRLCAEQGVTVYAWEFDPERDVVTRSSGSKFLGVEHSPVSRNCVMLRYRLKGGGPEATAFGAKVGCKEPAWFEVRIALRTLAPRPSGVIVNP